MTIASIKRCFPSLVRQAERELGLRFKKKPVLSLRRGGPPRGKIYEDGRCRVIISRRIVRSNGKVAKSNILHELREQLVLSHTLPPHPLGCGLEWTGHVVSMHYDSLRDEIDYDEYGRRTVRTYGLPSLVRTPRKHKT